MPGALVPRRWNRSLHSGLRGGREFNFHSASPPRVPGYRYGQVPASTNPANQTLKPMKFQLKIKRMKPTPFPGSARCDSHVPQDLPPPALPPQDQQLRQSTSVALSGKDQGLLLLQKPASGSAPGSCAMEPSSGKRRGGEGLDRAPAESPRSSTGWSLTPASGCPAVPVEGWHHPFGDGGGSAGADNVTG